MQTLMERHQWLPIGPYSGLYATENCGRNTGQGIARQGEKEDLLFVLEMREVAEPGKASP